MPGGNYYRCTYFSYLQSFNVKVIWGKAQIWGRMTHQQHQQVSAASRPLRRFYGPNLHEGAIITKSERAGGIIPILLWLLVRCIHSELEGLRQFAYPFAFPYFGFPAKKNCSCAVGCSWLCLDGVQSPSLELAQKNQDLRG